MSSQSVNIIAFDIPYPATYGGVIDVFYKVKTLHKMGVEIILHCFEYNKARQSELEKYCKQVYYYTRKKGIRYQFSLLPYIVITRNDRKLLERLCKNSFPILFEGLHSCYFLQHPDLKNRRKIVRTHNIEHDYYKGIQKASNNLARKIYYYIESRKLKKFEKVLKHANTILSISEEDQKHFVKQFSNVHFLPAFHSYDEVRTQTGKGSYILYHGNLSVEENQLAASFLIDKVFSRIKTRFIIAGKSPDRKLIDAVNKFSNIELISDPTPEKMDELLVHAQACVLPTFQSTGLKLKLLASLFSSRFVVANTLMIQNTSLEDLCEKADSPEEFIDTINKINTKEFNEKQRLERIDKLRSFSNAVNGDKLLKIIKMA